MAAADRDIHSPSQKMLSLNSSEVDRQDENQRDDKVCRSIAEAKMSEPTNRCSFMRALLFQYFTIIATARLFIYIFKLYEDSHSVQKYYNSSDVNFAILSAACLALPPLFYSIYLIGEHLTRSATIDNNEIATKMINGLLLIPWQIKRHLDVLHYSVQRICQWRSPSEKETQDLQSIKRSAEILEFFEDIYAGFLGILLQTYLLFLSQMSKPQNGTSPGLPAFRSSELVASSLCVVSMLIAVRRRDDGPLTTILSMLGWTCIFVSRVISFTLATVVVRGWICIFFVSHILVVTLWVFRIAIDSHSIVQPNETRAPGFIVNGEYLPRDVHASTVIKRRPLFTAFLVLLYFGIPSLLIWPFMFQLRERKRPFIFLGIVIVENCLLTLVYFAFAWSDLYYPVVVIASTAAGSILLSLYTILKPSLTDQVVLCHIRESRNFNDTGRTWTGQTTRGYNATKYGIYYEFCDLVFRLPSTQTIPGELREIQSVIE